MRTLLLAGTAAAVLAPVSAAAQDASPTTVQAAPHAHDEIVVTASPFATKQDNTPAIVAKVDRSTILSKGGSSIASALADVPGISSSGFATGASRPIIRGMDANRVRIMEDGVSSSDVSDIGPDHGIPIDPLSAQSIEVVRGAATLRYGSQAIGGAVNVLNNRVPMALPDKTISGEVNGSYGTVADAYETSALADAKAGNLAIHADGFYRHADDYDTPLGTQVNSYSHTHGETLGGSYFMGDSHVGAAVTQYNANYGIPSDDTHIVMKQTKVMSRNAFDLGSGLFKTLTIDGSYATYKHSEVTPDGDIATTFRNKEYDGRAELLLGPMGPLRNTAVGVEVQHRRFSAVGEDSSYLSPTLTKTQAGYVFTELPLGESVNLQASGRFEHVGVDGTPASDRPTRNSFNPVSGAVGALWTINPAIKLGITASSTGRAPAQTELFARGGHDGPDTFETGDPDLRIERANSIEASLRLRTDRFHFDGSLYSTWFKHYIYGDLTGRTCDSGGVCLDDNSGELRELFYRQQDAHFRGIEGEATYDLVKTDKGVFQARVLADYTRATLDDGSNVPRIPPYRIGGGVSWKGTKLDTGIDLQYYGKQDKFGDFDTSTPSYVNLDAQIAWRPFDANPGIEFAVIGQYLTDDVQRNAAALNKDVVVMPGRNVRFVARLAI
jgi:iron complex outermembrane receptor protein